MPSKGKTLVILESGSKVKKVQGFLGSNYIVKACFGHCRDLPVKTLGVDPGNNYEPTYEIYKDKKKIVAELRKAYKEAGDLIVATDLDREGEAMGSSVRDAQSCPEEAKTDGFQRNYKDRHRRRQESPSD